MCLRAAGLAGGAELRWLLGLHLIKTPNCSIIINHPPFFYKVQLFDDLLIKFLEPAMRSRNPGMEFATHGSKYSCYGDHIGLVFLFFSISIRARTFKSYLRAMACSQNEL